MNKENSSFLNKLDEQMKASGQRQLKRQNIFLEELNTRKLNAEIEEQNHLAKVNQTKQEFTALGIVSAFDELIKNNFIFIKKENIVKSEPIYNFWGKTTGWKEKEYPQITPSFYVLSEKSISLVVEEHIFGFDSNNDGHIETTKAINVSKLENGKYQLFLSEEHGCESDKYEEFIKPVTVNREEVLDNLARLVTTYRELRLWVDEGNSLYYIGQDKKDLFPHFP